MLEFQVLTLVSVFCFLFYLKLWSNISCKAHEFYHYSPLYR